MSDDELKSWFWNKFNSCYYVTNDDYPKSIFMYYDIDFIRKSKFRFLQGKEIIYPEKPSGICLFEQDHKNGWLFCDSYNIWSFFESNYNHNYQEIRDLLKGWLEEEYNLKVLTPQRPYICKGFWLEEESNLKVLIPKNDMTLNLSGLEEESKLKVLTPISSFVKLHYCWKSIQK